MSKLIYINVLNLVFKFLSKLVKHPGVILCHINVTKCCCVSIVAKDISLESVLLWKKE